MKSIPRNLLIHSAQIRTTLSEDRFGDISYSQAVTLEHIRIDKTDGVDFSVSDEENGCSAVLIYDAVNSLPADFVFSAGQSVLHAGRIYTVRTVSLLYDNSRLHHAEVTLV